MILNNKVAVLIELSSTKINVKRQTMFNVTLYFQMLTIYIYVCIQFVCSREHDVCMCVVYHIKDVYKRNIHVRPVGVCAGTCII